MLFQLKKKNPRFLIKPFSANLFNAHPVVVLTTWQFSRGVVEVVLVVVVEMVVAVAAMVMNGGGGIRT